MWVSLEQNVLEVPYYCLEWPLHQSACLLDLGQSPYFCTPLPTLGWNRFINYPKLMCVMVSHCCFMCKFDHSCERVRIFLYIYWPWRFPPLGKLVMLFFPYSYWVCFFKQKFLMIQNQHFVITWIAKPVLIFHNFSCLLAWEFIFLIRQFDQTFSLWLMLFLSLKKSVPSPLS